MKNEELYISKDKCFGCMSCLLSCPKKAISIRVDEAGFYFPDINQESCIDCGVCKKHCPIDKEPPKNIMQDCYAAQARNVDLKQVASGGLFASIAREFVEGDGVVFGSVLEKINDKFVCHHKKATCWDEVIPMLGSKYMQSNAFEIFKEVKDVLKSEKKRVLFSGTPCQISGLKNYLNNDYDNLFTIEIICHGVPSVELFNKYIKALEEKENFKIVNFRFREKRKGWGKTASYLAVSNKGKLIKKYFQVNASYFYSEFEKGSIFRQSCYKCPFAQRNRIADITIGDFWHFEEMEPQLVRQNRDLREEKGISCLLVNSEKGNTIISKFGKFITKENSSFSKISKYNPQLDHPTKSNYRAVEIFEHYQDFNDQHIKLYKRQAFLLWIKRVIPKKLKISILKFRILTSFVLI